MSEIVRATGPVVHAVYDRNRQSFADLVSEAVEVQGSELLKDNNFDELVGIPFLITRVTFHPSYPDPANKKRRLAYVSCEAVVADLEYCQRRKVDLSSTRFLGGDHVVINDGSTGIYRQIMAVLESQGYVTLPDLPVSGHYAETRFDCPPSEWLTVEAGETRMGEVGTPGEGFLHAQFDVRILAPRGIRISEGYGNEWTQDGKTRYLA